MDEFRRALFAADAETLREGFHYTLKRENYTPPEKHSIPPVMILDEDTPGAADKPPLTDPQSSMGQYFTPAFGIYWGGGQVAVAGIHRISPDLIEIGVETIATHQKKGYGLAVVAAAAEWVMAQGALPYYRAFPSNTGSVRIARRLGFKLTWQNIYA
ncbi:MAG: GNAT family N-acetyltransferase [Deltaproteobacteria bacterium]|nr:GNAT family N-acetyltransferase [Deltaproteobacteria bacterium]